MNIHLKADEEQIVNDELRSGHSRTPEEVIAKALSALREKQGLPRQDSGQAEAVREMLAFVEKNRTPLHGTSVKQLIREGHRL